MRWSRLLPRRRNPHTVLITGVKAAVRAGSASKIQKVLLTTRTQVGLGLFEAQELYLIIAGRVDNSMGHEEASTRLTALAASMAHQSKSATTWFSVENLSRTIGCFRASHEFTASTHSHEATIHAIGSLAPFTVATSRLRRSPGQTFLATTRSKHATRAIICGCGAKAKRDVPTGPATPRGQKRFPAMRSLS